MRRRDYYTDDPDEPLRRHEEQRWAAERRQLLSTGSLSDASEAFGHNPWALNAYLARQEDSNWTSRFRELSRPSPRRRTVHDKDLLRRSYDEVHPPFPKDEIETEDLLLFDEYELERFGQVPPHTIEDAPPVYVMDDFGMVHIPVQQDTFQFREMVSMLYPSSDEGLPF